MSIEFKDNSKEIKKKLDNAIGRSLTAIGMAAEDYAKEGTPVDTGRLRNSISNKVDSPSVYIGTNVEYAPYIEFGSRHNHRPAHMLQKSATGHSQEYKNIVKESLQNA